MIRSSHTKSPADETPLAPEIAAELAALDAALRGDAIDDEGLAALVRDVQAQAPVLPSELRERLTEGVEAGFPRRGRAARDRAKGAGAGAGAGAKPTRRSRLVFGPGIAVAATAVICMTGVVVTQTDLIMSTGRDDVSTAGEPLSAEKPVEIDQLMNTFESTPGALADSSAGTEQSDRFQRANPSGAAAEAAPSADRSSPSIENFSSTTQSSSGVLAPSSPGAVSQAEIDQINRQQAVGKANTSTPASGKRRVEQAVDLAVRVKSGGLDDAAGKVADITRQAGGYVADSRVTARTRGAGSATFTLQVASSKLDQAVDGLSDLGTVTRQDQQSTDITSSFDSAGQRLNDAKAVRRALLRSLDKATGEGAIASLRTRIADNRKTISGLEANLKRLEARTNLTTIALTLRAPSGDAPDTDDDGSWSVGDAAGDAVGILGTVTGVLLVGAAALLPFGVLAAIAVAIYRVRRRRRRDAALGD